MSKSVVLALTFYELEVELPELTFCGKPEDPLSPTPVKPAHSTSPPCTPAQFPLSHGA